MQAAMHVFLHTPYRGDDPQLEKRGEDGVSFQRRIKQSSSCTHTHTLSYTTSLCSASLVIELAEGMEWKSPVQKRAVVEWHFHSLSAPHCSRTRRRSLCCDNSEDGSSC